MVDDQIRELSLLEELGKPHLKTFTLREDRGLELALGRRIREAVSGACKSHRGCSY